MPGLYFRQDSTRWEQECEGYLSHSRPVLASSRCSQKHIGKPVPSQKKREFLECFALLSKALWLHSCSVLGPFTDYLYRGKFLLSITLWLHSRSVLGPFTDYLYRGKFFFSSRLFCDFRELYLSYGSHTRMWMSTFVRTSSHSQFLESLDEYPWQECKPGIMDSLDGPTIGLDSKTSYLGPNIENLNNYKKCVRTLTEV